MTAWAGGCEELAKALGWRTESDCCSSCHEDAEFGYHDLLEVEYDGKLYLVCCRMSEAVKP